VRSPGTVGRVCLRAEGANGTQPGRIANLPSGLPIEYPEGVGPCTARSSVLLSANSGSDFRTESGQINVQDKLVISSSTLETRLSEKPALSVEILPKSGRDAMMHCRAGDHGGDCASVAIPMRSS
jgi:hypothetical protein